MHILMNISLFIPRGFLVHSRPLALSAFRFGFLIASRHDKSWLKVRNTGNKNTGELYCYSNNNTYLCSV